jgi:hypothetical protein
MPSGYWHYITYLDGGFSVSYRKMAHNMKFKLIGLLSFAVYMPIDKVMNRLLGNKWLAKKERMAEMRAKKVISKITPPGNSVTIRDLESATTVN